MFDADDAIVVSIGADTRSKMIKNTMCFRDVTVCVLGVLLSVAEKQSGVEMRAELQNWGMGRTMVGMKLLD